MKYYEIQRHCAGTDIWMRGGASDRRLDKVAAEEAAATARKYLLSACDDVRVAEYEIDAAGELVPVTITAASSSREVIEALVAGMAAKGYTCVDTTGDILTFATGAAGPNLSMTE